MTGIRRFASNPWCLGLPWATYNGKDIGLEPLYDVFAALGG